MMTDLLPAALRHYDLALASDSLLVCFASSLAAVAVVAHLKQAEIKRRRVWIFCAALTGGFGIWVTHFTAMLGFHGPSHTAYRLDLTGASLGLVIVGLFVALSALTRATTPIQRASCGALIGLTIAAMHYLGMTAAVGNAVIQWNAGLIGLSIGLGVGGGALTGLMIVRADGLLSKFVAASAMASTTLSVHATGMAAYQVIGLCNPTKNTHMLVPGNQTLAIIGSALLVVCMTYLGVFLHGRDQGLRREMQHMVELANATIEALLICDREIITAANDSFCRLVNLAPHQIIGQPVTAFVPIHDIDGEILGSGEPVETVVLTEHQDAIAVEIHAHNVPYAGKQQIAYAIHDVRKRKESEDEIRRLANFDTLTQLPNRNHFYTLLRDAIEQAAETGTRLALVCIDLDHFKQINDHYGHRVGDDFLQRATNVMGRALSSNQILGRVGGDEFALIMPNMTSQADAGKITETILEAFAHDNAAIGSSIKLSASLGIAFFPDDAATKLELINAADSAMYKAKREGRNRARYFDTRLAHDARKRHRLATELQEAIQNKSLNLVYQPQMNCATGQFVGKEALLRWTSPSYGAIEPSLFIAIAEEIGEIGRIGAWVLETACREASSWPNQMMVSVNVSSVQIIDLGFAHRVHETLVLTGLSPNRLELEITETVLIHDFERALQALRKIKALGVRIAMDDFGTGYSSLYNLRSFPFDTIKIDQSFVRNVHRDLPSAAIVRAAIGLGKGLGVDVLAEGVETQEEMQFLVEAGCDKIQGYFVGYPESPRNGVSMDDCGLNHREIMHENARLGAL